jgi:hypothetical protein
MNFIQAMIRAETLCCNCLHAWEARATPYPDRPITLLMVVWNRITIAKLSGALDQSEFETIQTLLKELMQFPLSDITKKRLLAVSSAVSQGCEAAELDGCRNAVALSLLHPGESER